MIRAFAEFELDRELYELRREGRAVPLEPKVFDVLAHLIDHRDRVVTKSELLDALWPGEAVSDSVLPRAIAAARRAVGDDGVRQQLIQTVHARGYRFIGTLRSATVPAAPSESAPRRPFVGREAAMERLEAALEAALSGRGCVALLVGEPGIGKTRAAEELASLARSRGARVLWGRSYEGEGAPAFWPWLQVLGAAVADARPDTLAADLGPGAADLANLVPELRGRMPDLARASGAAGEQARFRLFDSAAGFLRRAAARQPLVVAIDDLHWADAASLLLFEFLAGALGESSILLIGTYRDTDVRREHPLGGVLGALARVPHCERIALRGLARDDVARFLAVELGAEPDPMVASAVHEMTDGNPFFIHELARWLAEPGRLPSQGAALVWSLVLPQSVRDAVGRRMETLSPGCNALLRAASVLGREFAGALLARLAELEPDQLLEPIAEALRAHVLVEVDVGRYAFTHALVRQTLYDELQVPERVRLHRRAGAALESAGGEDRLAELAHHFFEATPGGDAAKAIDYSVRAAERAHRLLAYEESARHYEQALAALEVVVPPDGARRCELLIAAGAELYAAGARERARARCQAAAELARRIGRSDLLARAAIEFRGSYEMGIPPEPDTLALLREALAAVGGESPCERARLLARLAGTESDMAVREGLSREAWSLARECGDPDALRDALGSRWWATLGPDRVAERHVVAGEILAVAARLGDSRTALLGFETRLGAHLIEGNMRAADAAITAYANLAEELRQPAFRFLSRVMRGSRALSAGRFAEAEALFREALGVGRGSMAFADAMFGGQVYWLLLQRGDPIDPLAAGGFFDALELRYPSGARLMRTSRAFIDAARGDAEAARAQFEAVAAHDFRDLQRDEHWLLTMAMLCDVAFALGDVRRAELLYKQLTPYAGLFAVHDLIRATVGSVHSLLGDLALLCGRGEEAVAHFEHAAGREACEDLEPARLASLAGLAGALRLGGTRAAMARADALIREVEAGCAALGVRSFGRLRARFEGPGRRRA